MPGIFDGVFRRPRQRPFATPQAAPGPGWMQGGMAQGQGAPPAYGSDAGALQQFGPGGLLLRQMMQGMMQSKDPRAILDPKLAGQFFSPETIGGLAPRFQRAFRKQQGKK